MWKQNINYYILVQLNKWQQTSSKAINYIHKKYPNYCRETTFIRMGWSVITNKQVLMKTSRFGVSYWSNIGTWGTYYAYD